MTARIVSFNDACHRHLEDKRELTVTGEIFLLLLKYGLLAENGRRRFRRWSARDR